MSYYTRVEIDWYDDESESPVDVEALLRSAEDYVRSQDLHQDAIDDLRSAFKGTENDSWGFNKMWSGGLEDLILSISKAYPKVLFLARGCGEELQDVWYREFKDGRIIRQEGPFVD